MSIEAVAVELVSGHDLDEPECIKVLNLSDENAFGEVENGSHAGESHGAMLNKGGENDLFIKRKGGKEVKLGASKRANDDIGIVVRVKFDALKPVGQGVERGAMGALGKLSEVLVFRMLDLAKGLKWVN